jgi:chromosome partitioning protein
VFTIRTLSIINLKGGVGKTISAVNMAYTLTRENYRVLLIDNDKQGNASKFFGIHDYNKRSISEVLTEKNIDLNGIIQKTKYERLDILPSNMTLLRADKEVMLDTTRMQQTRLSQALKTVNNLYDYVVIDNAPDLSMSIINAMVASNDVLIPIKIDKFSLDGLSQLIEQVKNVHEFNPELKITGGFVTMYQRNNVNSDGLEYLRENSPIPIMETTISKTVKVDESTFVGEPLLVYAPKAPVTEDYCRLTTEYLQRANY